MKLTAHFHTEPRLKMCWIPVFMAWYLAKHRDDISVDGNGYV